VSALGKPRLKEVQKAFTEGSRLLDRGQVARRGQDLESSVRDAGRDPG
jgi:hypothetical protein